jgi:hypothetical protein
MQYSMHLPTHRALVVPAAALALGAAGATGIYALIDSGNEVNVLPEKVIVAPAPSSTASAARVFPKDEAATAAAVRAGLTRVSPGSGSRAFPKDEAATAAAVSAGRRPVPPASGSRAFPKDEAATAAAVSAGADHGSPSANQHGTQLSGARP